MFKKVCLSFGMMSLLGVAAMASSEVQKVCGKGPVINIMVCRSSLVQGGHNLSLCHARNGKDYVDVYGIVAEGGRTGVIATYAVKRKTSSRPGDGTHFLDLATNGKRFELDLPMVAPLPNGGVLGILELDGRRDPELRCVWTR